MAQIIIDDRNIKVPSESIRVAGKAVYNILTRAKELSKRYNIPDFYITFLLLMHSMTGQYLSQMLDVNPDVIEDIYSKTEESRRAAARAMKQYRNKKRGQGA